MLSRRLFLKLSALLAGSTVMSTALTGCQRSDKAALAPGECLHGVASGDPTPDGFILWTRLTPAESQASPLPIAWEIAKEADFQDILRSGDVTPNADNDFTVKVDVRELEPGTDYFYRFLTASGTSSAGRARTLPTGSPEQLRLAIMSCSNYPAGYFHVYRAASQLENLDAWLHLGDYIYEYSGTGYATEDAARLGRELPGNNNAEILTLEDYRRRYAHYRTDPDLQAMHASAPCIAVWDDHEIANDTWRNGAENHSEDEGDFTTRKLAAIRAYYEWMPIRPPAGVASEQIYRQFTFGDLLNLLMLDTRIIGRDQQLTYADYRDKETGQFDQARFVQDLSQPQRSLLGEEQRQWLYQRLDESTAQWQVLGQQLLMARMLMPAEMFAAPSRDAIPALLQEMVALKQKQLDGAPLTAAEQGRLAAMPYNLDAWDGYPAERERLLATAKAQGKYLISLAGDTHNGWFSVLTDQEGAPVGVELATPSVSSPGMEKYLQMDENTAVQTADALATLIEDLRYCNLHQRGFLTLDIDRARIVANWRYLDTIKSEQYQIANTHQEIIQKSS